MRNRTRMIAAAAAVTAALAAGSTVAVAAATGGKPGAPAKTTSASEKPGHDAMVAAVARELHVGTARVSAALQPLFAAGHADTSSPAFAAAARALGVSTGQLQTALAHAKQSLAAGPYAKQSPDGAKTLRPAPRPPKSGRATTRWWPRSPRSCTSARPGSARRSSRCSRRAMPTRRRRRSRRPPVRSASAPISWTLR